MMINKEKIPNTIVILSFLAIIAVIITYIIPSGAYDYAKNDSGQSIIIDGTFHLTNLDHIGFLDFFNAFFQGLSEGSSIIFFLLIVGGAFGIVGSTKAFDGLTCYVIEKFKGKEIYIIPAIILFFALCAGTYGMIEGAIVFIFFLLPMMTRLGYDAIVAAALPLVGTAVGYTGSFINPFNVGVAQAIAELPLFSGITYRIFCWFVFVVIASCYIMLYAKRVKSNPKKSIVYGLSTTSTNHSGEQIKLQFKHILILLALAISLIIIIIGVSTLGWYLKEMSSIFLMLGIVSGIIAKMSPNEIATAFSQGCKDIFEGALAVGLAFTIVVIIKEGGVLDTIVYYLSGTVHGLPSTAGAEGMLVIQSLMNYIVSSGSGQAALTMPIMTPLADILDVNRQVAVLAFQFGDGISNSFTPTAGWLMAGLAIARIPWTKWAKFIIPLLLIQYIVAGILVAIANIYIWPN